MTVSIKNISKKFGKQLVLDHVSFEISRGEITGLVGPNGAGKTTLMRIIVGLIPCDEGEVSINGIKESIEIKKIIGYLPENNPLYPEMFVREYLEYAADHYPALKDKKKRIEEIILLTGLSPECNKKISELSKGYRQRVGIAQALLHDPQILILDEPTTGLDPNQIIEIRELISKLGKEKTIILSTHMLKEVEAICNKVIIVGNGKILANGRPDEINTDSAGGLSTLLVEFDKKPVLEQLENISGIVKLFQLDGNRILIGYLNSSDIRPLVFKFAVDTGLTVLSMQKKEKSLEEVFVELTKE